MGQGVTKLSLCVAFCIAASFSFAVSEPLSIARRGEQANCAVVVATNADECVRYAAKELCDYTKRMTGVELPIVSADETPAPKRAVVLSAAGG